MNGRYNKVVHLKTKDTKTVPLHTLQVTTISECSTKAREINIPRVPEARLGGYSPITDFHLGLVLFVSVILHNIKQPNTNY